MDDTNAVERHIPVDVTAVWGAPLMAIHCAHCGEAHLVPDGALPGRCPYCLQGPVAPQPAYLRGEPPEQMLTYKVADRGLAGVLERWAAGGWFRPDDMNTNKLLVRARRYLVPLWLADSHVEATWRADVGFDYQVVSSQDHYREGGGWVSRDVEETRVNWEPRVGRLNRTYENVAAPALDDHRAVMRRLGRFDLDERVAYTPDALVGAVVRIPSLDPDAAWPGAEAALVRSAEADCQAAAGADHIRDFTVAAEYTNLNWTQLLLPAYVTWYEEGGQVWPVLVNGQSGRVDGVKRASARKAQVAALVLGALGVLLFVFGGLLALVGAVFPPLVAVGGVVLVAGVLLALVAPAPMIGVWVSNRRTGDAGAK
ncbi:MAG: hypothetical protein JXD18_15240 [Anaerolineae bacterium]|nr:hypothetical protein [Anaerolineae bacterium]